MLRNILASPRVPSCVLNHFPVDSAVCNPIISVSPPGKLLFYSRTTRAPDVPCTAHSRSLFPPSSFLLPVFTFHSLFYLRREVNFNSTNVREHSFFPTASLVALLNLAYFALLDFTVVNSSGSRKPVVRARKLNERSGNDESTWKESRRKLNFTY